jgi:hypothetical protein
MKKPLGDRGSVQAVPPFAINYPIRRRGAALRVEGNERGAQIVGQRDRSPGLLFGNAVFESQNFGNHAVASHDHHPSRACYLARAEARSDR